MRTQCPFGFGESRSHESITTTMRWPSRLLECRVAILTLGTRASSGMNVRSAFAAFPPASSFCRSSWSGRRVPAYSRQFLFKMPTMRPSGLSLSPAFGGGGSEPTSFSAKMSARVVTWEVVPKSASVFPRSRSDWATSAADKSCTTTTSPSTARLRFLRPPIRTSFPPSRLWHVTAPEKHEFINIRNVPWKNRFFLMPSTKSICFKCAG
mmetsp:Transcript_46767/g.101666  ORF Transcript_46767/g.101666 Transcript_46767/m.101666 type:complete len:209 (+) Transcript_46767:206-832(+)